ncbi:MAG: hypothetical protein M0036_23835 [Desulfobacteraceae bacterium]|nr:hypothetical protein [Desulfobacteraceae bacterium]
MKYSDLLKARRKAGDTPTLKQRQWSDQEKAWRDAGRCIECGQAPPVDNSLICASCLAAQSLDDIQREIEALRRDILNHPKNK